VTLDPALTRDHERAGNTTGVGIVEVYAYNPVAPVLNLANANSSAIHYGFLAQRTPMPCRRKPGTRSLRLPAEAITPERPPELTVEWAISKVPGDFQYYKSSEAKVNGQTPCGGTNGAVGGSYY
jgi:hypothetical protein